MVRLFNYFVIGLGLVMPVTQGIENVFLWAAASLTLLLCVMFLVETISYEENVYIMGFMVTLPFILYITELPTANTNMFMFLGTVFLAVAVPLVVMFLLAELLVPAED